MDEPDPDLEPDPAGASQQGWSWRTSLQLLRPLSPYGLRTVSLRSPYGVPTVSLRCPYGLTLSPYGLHTVSLRSPYGLPMISLRCPYGFPTISLRCPYGVRTVSLRSHAVSLAVSAVPPDVISNKTLIQISCHQNPTNNWTTRVRATLLCPYLFGQEKM